MARSSKAQDGCKRELLAIADHLVLITGLLFFLGFLSLSNHIHPIVMLIWMTLIRLFKIDLDLVLTLHDLYRALFTGNAEILTHPSRKSKYRQRETSLYV